MALAIYNEPPDALDGLSVEEITPSPNENFTEDGFRATRIFKCPWGNRLQVAARLKGRSRVNADGSYTFIRPHAYPDFTRAVVSSVAISPFFPDGESAASGERLQYNNAELTVEYATPSFSAGGEDTEDPSQTYVTESLEPFVEFLTLSHEKLFWDDAGTESLAETESPAKVIRGVEWVYRIHRLQDVPSATFTLIGKINENAVTSVTLGTTFAAKTLLFNPPVLDREITSEGTQAWTLTYRFTYRPDTWEKFHRSGMDLPQFMYKKDGTQFKPYEYGDFAQLVSGLP